MSKAAVTLDLKGNTARRNTESNLETKFHIDNDVLAGMLSIEVNAIGENDSRRVMAMFMPIVEQVIAERL